MSPFAKIYLFETKGYDIRYLIPNKYIIERRMQKKFGENVFSWGYGQFSLIPTKFLATSF